MLFTVFKQTATEQEYGWKPPSQKPPPTTSNPHKIRCSARKSNSNFYIMREKHLIELETKRNENRGRKLNCNQHILQGHFIRGLQYQIQHRTMQSAKVGKEETFKSARSCCHPGENKVPQTTQITRLRN